MKFREEIGADTIIDDYDPPEVRGKLFNTCTYALVTYYVGAKGMLSWWNIWRRS